MPPEVQWASPGYWMERGSETIRSGIERDSADLLMVVDMDLVKGIALHALSAIDVAV